MVCVATENIKYKYTTTTTICAYYYNLKLSPLILCCTLWGYLESLCKMHWKNWFLHMTFEIHGDQESSRDHEKHMKKLLKNMKIFKFR